ASFCSTKFFCASSSAGVSVCAATRPVASTKKRAARKDGNWRIKNKATRQDRQSERWRRPDHCDIHFHVSGLAVDRLVEADLFVRIFDPHRGDAIDDPKHAERENQRPDRREQSRGELFQKETRVTGEKSVHAAI